MSNRWQATSNRNDAGRGTARSRHPSPVTRHSSAFTLIEIMIVVAIIGLIAAMGVPAVFQTFRKEGMRRAVSEVQQLLGDARARAIYSGRTTQVVFHPAEKRMEITDAPMDATSLPAAGAPAPATATLSPPTLGLNAQNSVVLPDNVDIAMLEINMYDFGAAEAARVRFFPNGTCDELTLVLFAGGEMQKITLEFSTSLASVGPVDR